MQIKAMWVAGIGIVCLSLLGCTPTSTIVLYDEDADGDGAVIDGDVSVDGDLDEEDDIAPVDGDGDMDLIDSEDEGDTLDGDEEQEIEVSWPEQPQARVVFDLIGPTGLGRETPYNRLPFPYDLFTVADSSKETGLRVNLLETANISIKITNTNLIDYGIHLMRSERYLDAINTMDGFSCFGYLFVEVTPGIDSADLPQTPEDSVEDTSLVMLVDVTEGSDSFGERIPIWVKAYEAVEYVGGKPYDPQDPETYVPQFKYLAIRSARPLAAASHFALVVKSGLKTTDGEPLGASLNFLAVSGQLPIPAQLPRELGNVELLKAEALRLAPVFASLESEAIGIAKADMLVAFDFTTQSVVSTMMEIENRINAGEDDPAPNFDVTGDDVPDVFTQPNTHPTGNEGYPTFGVDFTHIGGYVHGVFKASEWRLPYAVDWNANRRRAIEYDDQGRPVNQGTDDVPFWLFFPKDTTKQPYPVVIIQHGINSRKEATLRLAPEFAEKGWATLVMDFPYHGEREVGFAPLEFIDIAYPLKARSSFIQAASEHVQAILMLKNWQADIFPAGGDSQVDIDGTRVAYVGQSLGGIVGGISISASRHLRGGVVNVGGGGLIDYVYDFLDQYGLVSLFPDHYFKQFSTIAQTILDAGDCINYATLARNPPEDWVTKSIIIQESIDDETVPNVVTDNLARAMFLPHLEPVERAVYGLTPTPAPQPRFGYTQYAPAHHNSLFGNPDTEVSTYRMREQANHFIETMFETGQAEVINPVP
jgi:dienelactone hydrolase